jgi:hypothetical protein
MAPIKSEARKVQSVELSSSFSYTLDEARMVLPGIQALFGFQMMAVFSQPFTALSQSEQITHFIAIALNVLAITLLMSPAAFHRHANPRVISEKLLQTGSQFVTAGMMPLMLSIVLDFYVIGSMILHKPIFAGIAACAIFILMCAFWFVLPKVKGTHHSDGREL